MISFISVIYVHRSLRSRVVLVNAQTETTSSVRYLIYRIGQPGLHVFILAQHPTWYHSNPNPPLYTFSSILRLPSYQLYLLKQPIERNENHRLLTRSIESIYTSKLDFKATLQTITNRNNFQIILFVRESSRHFNTIANMQLISVTIYLLAIASHIISAAPGMDLYPRVDCDTCDCNSGWSCGWCVKCN